MSIGNGTTMIQGGYAAFTASDVIGIILQIALILLAVSLTALAVLIFIRLLKRRPFFPGMSAHAPWMPPAPTEPFPGNQCPPAHNMQAPPQKKPEPIVDLSSAVVILNERFAKGEINEEEYRKKKEEMFRIDT